MISHDPTNVYLVEVKYRSRINSEDIKKTTASILERWKLAHVFYATPEGFYFDKCVDLTKDSAKITPLSFEMVGEELQKEYLKLLREFID